jgi:6-phospho-beta-glucosidase
MKVSVIGCGLRTPLLIHGLVHSGLPVSRLSLYDLEPDRAALMAALGRAIAGGGRLAVSSEPDLAKALQDSSFVISSIRVGGMAARAADERLALECGFAGQETTGPAGFAMALRTVPVAIEQARLVEKLAPEAWLINFTNPAGLMTQAISTHTQARVVGICDTPAELFFRIALALEEPPEDVECDYLGLNHLGWVQTVNLRGENLTSRLLDNADLLNRLYTAPLFPPELIRSLRLIPTEYVFFYYRARNAVANQKLAGATRGEELMLLNGRVLAELESNVRKGDIPAALNAYRGYLNRRNASYMHLEGSGESALQQPDVDWNPFEGATGYHRIAVDAIAALTGSQPSRLVLNVPNQGAIADLADEDVIEVPCLVDKSGARPVKAQSLPAAVKGLTIAVKTYERLTIEAALAPPSSRRTMAIQALFSNPIVADWDAARDYVDRLA